MIYAQEEQSGQRKFVNGYDTHASVN